MATQTPTPYEASGGAGGKFRKKPFRRSTQSTPYDRPPTALRPTTNNNNNNNNNNNRGSWISMIVDPASKLITAGAHKFFSSVFRKRLLPPPPSSPSRSPAGDSKELTAVEPETETVVGPSTTEEPIMCEGNNVSSSSDRNAVADLEDILKQKTFSRSEIDRLTTLLRSRTVENSVGVENGRSEPESTELQAARHEKFSSYYLRETPSQALLPGANSTPVVRPQVHEGMDASPADLAKAYMGSRPTRVSPSAFGLQNQVAKEDLSTSYSQRSRLKSLVTSPLQKAVGNVGTFENGFVSPRFRGRSAIYSMARTPYARIHPSAVVKTSEPAFGTWNGSPSSQMTNRSEQTDGSKRQAMKRRSSVLESDIGSVGPIRRIRQKPNLLHIKSSTLPGTRGPHINLGSDTLLDVRDTPSSSDRPSVVSTWSKAQGDNSLPGTSSRYVPAQSIETAQKIFLQLDKITPKGKSPDMKTIDTQAGNLTPKFKAAVEDGIPHKSLGPVGSMKSLQNVQDDRRENGSSGSDKASELSHQILPVTGEASLQNSMAPNNLAYQNVVQTRAPISQSSPKTKAGDNIFLKSGHERLPKRRAFQMSAHEDFLELDDDVHSNGVAPVPSTDGVVSVETPERSIACASGPEKEATAMEKHQPPIHNPSTNSIFSSKEPSSLSDGPAVTDNSSSFAFPALPSSSFAISSIVQTSVDPPQATAEVNKGVFQNELNKPASLSFPVSDKWLGAVGSAGLKDTKVEAPNSVHVPAAELNGPAKVDNNSSPVNLLKKSEDVQSVGVSTGSGTRLPGTATANSVSSLPDFLSSNKSSVSPTFTEFSQHPVTNTSGLANGLSESTSTVGATSCGTIFGTGGFSSTSIFSAGSNPPSFPVAFPSFSTGPNLQPALSGPSTSVTLPASAPTLAADSGAKSNETPFGNIANGIFSSKLPESDSVKTGVSGAEASTFKTTSSETLTAPVFGIPASLPESMPSTSTVVTFSSQPVSTESKPFSFIGNTNSKSTAGIFSSAPASPFGLNSTQSSISAGTASLVSAGLSSGFPTPVFGTSSWSNSIIASAPIFGTSSSSGFTIGGSTTAVSNTPPAFGASTGSLATNANAPFVFGSAVASASIPSTVSGSSPLVTSTQPAFGSNSTPTFPFSTTPPGNNYQMTMEDSMAEDSSVQASTPPPSSFNQLPAPAPSSPFGFATATPGPTFGATNPSAGNPFMFNSQQNQMAQNPSLFQPSGQNPSPFQPSGQNPSPFQASGSMEFNAVAGGSFSLGTGGTEKSARRIVKINKNRRKK